MVKIYVDEFLNSETIKNAGLFIQKIFNFNFEFINADINLLEKSNLVISNKLLPDNNYVIYPADKNSLSFKISTITDLKDCATIADGVVSFNSKSRLSGISIILDDPFMEYIRTSELGVASRINGYKYYKVKNFNSGISDLINGQHLCEKILNLPGYLK